jgi:hypothetical protein
MNDVSPLPNPGACSVRCAGRHCDAGIRLRHRFRHALRSKRYDVERGLGQQKLVDRQADRTALQPIIISRLLIMSAPKFPTLLPASVIDHLLGKGRLV